MDKTNSAYDSVLENLEHGSYVTYSFISPREVVNKIIEFSNYFNSTGRIALLNAEAGDCLELVPLLLTLKKNIKSAVSELGKKQYNKIQKFVCSECEDILEIPSYSNLWETLQDHEHFEALYWNFLNGKLKVLPVHTDSSDEMEMAANCNDHITTEPTDSGIEQYEEHINETGSLSPEEEVPLGDNSFQFNFTVHYDPQVEKALYPESFASMTKFDQCPYRSVLKISSCQAVCLLCQCDLMAAKRIGKKQCLNHIVGQRHMKMATNPAQIENLQNFHEVFLNMDACYQAHQVYFEPSNTTSLVCKLCNIRVPIKFIIDHINCERHKTVVIAMFIKNSSEFYLMDLQVASYGIEKPPEPEVSKPVASPREQIVKEKSEQKQSTSASPKETETQHNIIPSIIDSGKNTLQDLLPHRFYSHIKYFKDRGDFICTLCKITIKDGIKGLKKHILSIKHQESSEEKLPEFTYFCEICNLEISNEVAWDKHFTEQNRHSKISKSRANKLKEYECIPCKTIIFGDEVSITRHTNKGSRRKKNQELSLAEEVKKMFSSRESLEEKAQFLAEKANNTVTCMQRTLDCCARLEEVLKTVLTECKAYPFGSRISGLGNQESDLDLFIDTGEMYMGRKCQDSLAQCQIIKQVAGILRKNRGEFERITEVPTARTPIVKVKHIGTQLECDLSFKHGLSVENTKFLRICLDIQPICQQFILLLKSWSECNRLSEHITTYAIAILAIFYLQINGYLLSVKKLRELNPAPAPVIDGWETIKYTVPVQSLKNHIIPYEHSLVRLLKDCFEYYSNFNYFEDTVCPLLGHTIPRKSFEDPRTLPPEMVTYIKQLKGPDSEKFRFMSPFCIQDPFDLSHNLTKACQSNTLSIFKKLCQLSYQHLELLK